ncbi:MAG: hypothetical protein VCA38_03815 [Roseibacillus sp.]|jgi:hypothetical protein
MNAYLSQLVSRFCLLLFAAAFPGQALGGQIIINDPSSNVDSYVARSTGGPDICIIGVYETQGIHPQGTANVHVRYDDSRPMIPLTLVLSSYEPTLWILDLAPGAVVAQIILNGLHPHEVANAGSIPVMNFSGPGSNGPRYLSACAYRWPSDNQGCNTPALVSGVQSLLGHPISAFSGVYRATDFTVVGSPVTKPLAITSISFTPAGLRLKIPWPTFGQRVGIEYSPSMSPGSWIELGNFFPANGDLVFTDPDLIRLARPAGYYRAFLRPYLR